MRRTIHRDDEGFALALALIAVTVIALVAAAVLAYASTSSRRVVQNRERSYRVTAANGGIRYAINRLQSDPAACLGRLGLPRQVINDYEVEVRCGYAADSVPRNAMALVITTAQPNALVNQGGLQDKEIEGPVFLTSLTDSGATGSASSMQGGNTFTIKKGSVYVDQGSNCGNPTNDPLVPPGWLKGIAPPHYYQECLNTTWFQFLQPQEVPANYACDPNNPAPFGLCLPASPSTINPAQRLTGPNPTFSTPGCAVFSPGRYQTASGGGFTLPLAAQNYFQSGVYYFHNTLISVKGETVLGGKPSLPGENLLKLNACNPAAENDSNGSGVTFILGGTSRIVVDQASGSRLQLYKRVPPSGAVDEKGIAGVTIIAAEDEVVPRGNPLNYLVSSLAQNQLGFDSGAGNNPESVVTGLVYTPGSYVRIDNVSNNADANFQGGIVAAGAEIQASKTGSGLVLSGGGGIGVSGVEIRSTAKGRSGQTDITAIAQVDVKSNPATGGLNVALRSWVVG